MSCCGHQRAALRDAHRHTASAPAQSVPPVLRAPIALAHGGPSATVARGAHTGLTYLFGADGAALEVDARDAPAMIASGLFRASG